MSKLHWSLATLIALMLAPSTKAQTIKTTEQDGVTVHLLTVGNTIAKVCPSGGANCYSIQVDGVEFMHQPESVSKTGGVSCGVPILYPTPNRVRDGEFSFGSKTVRFEPNAGPNFIHGLVNNLEWEVVDQTTGDESVALTCKADFQSGSLSKRFPFPHTLLVTIRVTEGQVRWTYEVDNSSGKESVPFGFALHPYFAYQGARKETYLTIPATHWMEGENMLPNGKLVPGEELTFPLNTPLSLENTKFDDVFWGMSTERPTLIDFRGSNRSITIRASSDFTHLVVWTPQRPFFGIESQTCSTDAHNLHASGEQKAAHLQICEPGEKLSGWVQYDFNLK